MRRARGARTACSLRGAACAGEVVRIGCACVTSSTLTLTPTDPHRDQEFIRIGYYVNTEYDAPELMEAPPEQIQYERLVRNILVDKPRVTRYQIDWTDNPAAAGMAPEGMATETTSETPAAAGAAEYATEHALHSAMGDTMGMPMADESMAVEAPMVMAE